MIDVERETNQQRLKSMSSYAARGHRDDMCAAANLISQRDET